MNDIDLYFEAKPRYHQLIPNKEDGLVLLALFQAYPKQEFNEDQILAVINRVYTDLGSQGSASNTNGITRSY
jgi:hypothetical protein